MNALNKILLAMLSFKKFYLSKKKLNFVLKSILKFFYNLILKNYWVFLIIIFINHYYLRKKPTVHTNNPNRNILLTYLIKLHMGESG